LPFLVCSRQLFDALDIGQPNFGSGISKFFIWIPCGK
jgi:hypothetical protein